MKSKVLDSNNDFVILRTLMRKFYNCTRHSIISALLIQLWRGVFETTLYDKVCQ